MPNKTIDRLSIKQNDDGTITIEVTPARQPETGKDGAPGSYWPDSKTMTADNIDGALKKVKELFAVKPAKGKRGPETALDKYFNRDYSKEA